MSIYAGALQVGIASGFIFGQVTSVGMGSWRWPYILEAALTAVLAALLLLAEKDPRFVLKRRQEGQEGGEVNSWGEQVCQLLANPTYMWLCLGEAAFVFTAASVGFWGADFQVDHFGADPLTAALVLGGIVVFAGLLGTLLGSILADCLLKPTQDSFEKGEVSEAYLMAKRILILCTILTIVTVIGACSGIGGAIADQYLVWAVTLSITVFSISLTNGPQSVALMTCVRPEIRGQAMALYSLLYLLLGGFPSPYTIGWINQQWGMFWGYIVTMSWLFLAALAWGLSWYTASRNYRLVSLGTPLDKEN